MTEFVIELLRLHGDEQWSEWGAGWWDHAERLGTLPSDGPGGWQLLDRFRGEDRQGTQLDWGALLFPVTKKELLTLYPATSKLRPPSSNAAVPPIELSDLSDDEKYGLVVVECA
jgi:hypothetical protein